jgi:hypothetical protein
MPSCEEEKPHLWVNLLEVNEHFEGKRNDKRAFLVSRILYKVLIIYLNQAKRQSITY